MPKRCASVCTACPSPSSADVGPGCSAGCRELAGWVSRPPALTASRRRWVVVWVGRVAARHSLGAGRAWRQVEDEPRAGYVTGGRGFAPVVRGHVRAGCMARRLLLPVFGISVPRTNIPSVRI